MNWKAQLYLCLRGHQQKTTRAHSLEWRVLLFGCCQQTLKLDPETNHSGVKIKTEIGEIAAVFQLCIDV